MRKMELKEAIDVLMSEDEPGRNVLRKLTNNLSVRKGKWVRMYIIKQM